MSEPSDLEIRPVDPFDDPTFARWHAVYVAALEDVVGEAAQVYELPETRVQWQQPTSDQVQHGFAGFDDGELVALGAVVLPQRENLTTAVVEVAVDPVHQGRGHGRTMLAHVEDVAREAGRTLLHCNIRWPYEAGSDGAGSRCVEFATASGFRLGLGDVQRWLDLPLDEDLLDELAAEAAPHHQGYELLTWIGPVPDDLAPTWVALDGSLMTEAPTGDLEIETMDVDVDRLREQEVSLARQNREAYHAVAVVPGAGGGREVVAYTTIAQGNASTDAFQWGTLVHRDHRGHRLGLAVKAANHRQHQRTRPDTRRVVTWNAEVNDHMIAVNERLGFRPASRMGEFQKRLADPARPTT